MQINRIPRPWNQPKEKKTKDFYLTPAWARKRSFIKVRDKGLCQYCLRNKTLNPGNICDHILPLALFPELAYEDTNLVMCCDKHHNHKRTVERGIKDRDLIKEKLKEHGYL